MMRENECDIKKAIINTKCKYDETRSNAWNIFNTQELWNELPHENECGFPRRKALSSVKMSIEECIKLSYANYFTSHRSN
jgi:hypothetical protein